MTPRGACDPLAGVHAAFAVVAALHFAERTGTGQQVELPMIETVLNATAIQPIEAEVFGKTLSRRGNRGQGGALQNIYRCAGSDDDWIAVTVCDDLQWARLVDLMARPSWADEGLSTEVGRRERADEIDHGLQEWFAGQPLESTVERLASAGIPAAPVVSPSLVTENAQLRERGFLRAAGPPANGFRTLSHVHRSPCWPGNTDGCCARRRRSASTMKRYCATQCGLTEEELAHLAASGVIGTRPVGL